MINIDRYSDAEVSKMFDLVSELIQVYQQDRTFRESIEEDEFVTLLTIQNATFERVRKQERQPRV